MKTESKKIRELGLVLEPAQLEQIREALLRRLLEGIHADGREIAMLPAFIPPPPEDRAGLALAVDAGGTNLRAALVELLGDERQARLSDVIQMPLPGSAGKPAASADEFFSAHCRALASLSPEPDLPLGYCFSYPIRSQPDGDAILTRWTKEVRVESVIGKPVGQMLRNHLEAHGYRPGPIAVLNDTIAALVAGASLPGIPAGRCVGLVVGTGTNMGAFLPREAVAKLPPSPYQADSMAVNFESGAFNPPCLSTIDEEVDGRSANPGDHRFEKAVSGAYLGQVFSAAARHLDLPGSDEPVLAADVSRLAANAEASGSHQLARTLIDRSADLVAAALAATNDLLGGTGDLHVCAEGTLFWKGSGFRERVESTLNRLLEGSRQSTGCHIFSVPNANLLGSAAAVLARM